MFRAPTVEGDGYAPSPIRLRVLSLGAGVQSTTLALMSAPACAGFAGRSISIAPPFRSTRPICRSKPITASSIFGATNVRACVVSDAGAAVRGERLKARLVVALDGARRPAAPDRWSCCPPPSSCDDGRSRSRTLCSIGTSRDLLARTSRTLSCHIGCERKHGCRVGLVGRFIALARGALSSARA